VKILTDSIVLLRKWGAFSLSKSDLFLFCGGPSSFACLAYQIVFDWSFSAAHKLCFFISDIKSYSLDGNDQPQINQPNGHADVNHNL